MEIMDSSHSGANFLDTQPVVSRPIVASHCLRFGSYTIPLSLVFLAFIPVANTASASIHPIFRAGDSKMPRGQGRRCRQRGVIIVYPDSSVEIVILKF